MMIETEPITAKNTVIFPNNNNNNNAFSNESRLLTDELQRLKMAVDQTFAILADIAPQILYETDYKINHTETGGSSAGMEDRMQTAGPYGAYSGGTKSIRNISTAAAALLRDEQDLLSLETLLVSRTRSGANLLVDEATAEIDSILSSDAAGGGGGEEELFDIPLSKPLDGSLWTAHQSPPAVPVRHNYSVQRSSRAPQSMLPKKKVGVGRPPAFVKVIDNHASYDNNGAIVMQPSSLFGGNTNGNGGQATVNMYQPITMGFLPPISPSSSPMQHYYQPPQQMIMVPPTVQMQFMHFQRG